MHLAVSSCSAVAPQKFPNGEAEPYKFITRRQKFFSVNRLFFWSSRTLREGFGPLASLWVRQWWSKYFKINLHSDEPQLDISWILIILYLRSIAFFFWISLRKLDGLYLSFDSTNGNRKRKKIISMTDLYCSNDFKRHSMLCSLIKWFISKYYFTSVRLDIYEIVKRWPWKLCRFSYRLWISKVGDYKIITLD